MPHYTIRVRAEGILHKQEDGSETRSGFYRNLYAEAEDQHAATAQLPDLLQTLLAEVIRVARPLPDVQIEVESIEESDGPPEQDTGFVWFPLGPPPRRRRGR